MNTEDTETRGILLITNLVSGLALGATSAGFATSMGVVGGWVGLQVLTDPSMRTVFRIVEQLSAAAIGFNLTRSMRNDWIYQRSEMVKRKRLLDEGDPGQEE